MTQRTNGDTRHVKEERMRELLAEEASNPLGWWYLSYADENGFRGGAIIKAQGFVTAAWMSNRLGISPGGEVTGHPIPDDELPPEPYRSRLLTLAEPCGIGRPVYARIDQQRRHTPSPDLPAQFQRPHCL